MGKMHLSPEDGRGLNGDLLICTQMYTKMSPMWEARKTPARKVAVVKKVAPGLQPSHTASLQTQDRHLGNADDLSLGKCAPPQLTS